MSRRGTAQKLHGVDVPPPAMEIDGVPVTSITVASSKPFAKAMVALLNERDGVAGRHDWKLGLKSFWAPKALIEAARRRVEDEARARSEERGSL